MLLVCTQVLLNGEIVPLTETLRQKITKDVEALNRDGLRVLAIADKKSKRLNGSIQLKMNQS